MLSDEALVIEIKKLSTRSLVILGLLENIQQPALTSVIRERAVKIGLREVQNWNISDILTKAEQNNLVVKLKTGWRLLPEGEKKLRESGFPLRAQIIETARHNLFIHAEKIKDKNRKAFFMEALTAFDNKCYRAAVVFSWVGAISIIQQHILEKYLEDFNKAGKDRFGSNFKAVKTINELANLKEADLLQLSQDCGMLDKSEKQELLGRLDLRNRCSHTNNFVLADHIVASHIESLALNVYSRY